MMNKIYENFSDSKRIETNKNKQKFYKVNNNIVELRIICKFLYLLSLPSHFNKNFNTQNMIFYHSSRI